MSPLILTVCHGCGDTGTDAIKHALSTAHVTDVELRPTSCLGPCDKPMVLSLQRAGMAGYVFAGVDLLQDANDIAATCALYLESPEGWIEDARPCGRLRHLLVARIPA